MRNHKRIAIICKQCSKSFFSFKSREGKYCSRNCFFLGFIGHKVSEETRKKLSRQKIGDKNPAKRYEVRLKIGKKSKEILAKFGHPMKGKHHTPESKQKISANSWMKGRTGDKHPQWLGDKIKREYPREFNKELKNKVIEKYGFIGEVNKCMHCEMTEVKHKEKYHNQRLAVHHIDYNKKNCAEDNLISLCHKCNTRANTNREFWTKYYMGIVRRTRLLSKLKRAWLNNKQLRFCQLISNLHGLGPQDIFYTQEEDLEKAIDEMLAESND